MPEFVLFRKQSIVEVIGFSRRKTALQFSIN
jgi:hypothetical protein